MNMRNPLRYRVPAPASTSTSSLLALKADLSLILREVADFLDPQRADITDLNAEGEVRLSAGKKYIEELRVEREAAQEHRDETGTPEWEIKITDSAPEASRCRRNCLDPEACQSLPKSCDYANPSKVGE